MTVSQKAALSLLISVFLFAGVAVLAYTGLFDLVETKFYNPSITRALDIEAAENAELINGFMSNLESRFSASLNDSAVRRSFLPNQSAADIFERSRIYGTLLEAVGGLQSVRFVDYAGARIHFSTFTADILNQDRLSTAYRNYTDDPLSLPFDTVQVASESPLKLTLDSARDRIIFSYPFHDSMDVYRGTALFTVSVRAIAERLISNGRIKVGEDVSVISDPPGIVSGSPGTAKSDILAQVASIWDDGILSPSRFDSRDSGTSLTLISAKTGQGIFYGKLVNVSVFSFPQPMKVILLVSIFLTIYLIVFFFFNLRQDTMTLVQHRLKGLQVSLIEQFYDRKGEMDWTHWTRELEQRREEIRAEVKRGIRINQGGRSDENIDSLIDKSWDELLAVIGAKQKTESGLDEDKLQNILNRILKNLPAAAIQTSEPQAAATGQPAPAMAPADAEADEAEMLEVLDGEDGEVVEELTELEDEETENTEAASADDGEDLEELVELDSADADEVETAAVGSEPPKAGGLLATAAHIQSEDAMEGDKPLDDESLDIGTLADSLEPADAEAVEDLEVLEELGAEEIAEEAAPVPSAPAGKGPSEQEILDLASKIEFSADPVSDTGDIDPLDAELEIVSPFASMLSSLEGEELHDDSDETDDTDESGKTEDDSGEAEKKNSIT